MLLDGTIYLETTFQQVPLAGILIEVRHVPRVNQLLGQLLPLPGY
jgi:hypothetical protein